MAYIIPQPMNVYSNPSANLPSLSFTEPREGKRVIPVEIAWPGNISTFQINVQGITTQPFSQIVMLDVDNSLSGADVTFYFPDTQDTLIVPAASAGLFPVFTQQVQVYVSAAQALASDVTRFRFLNYRQEPVSLPPPVFSEVATANNLGAAGTTAIVAATISGALTGWSVNVNLNANAAADSGWVGSLIDHDSGAVIDQVNIIVPTAQFFFGIVMNVSGTAIRFAGGIDFIIANNGAAFASQSANVAVRYRTP